MFDKSVNIQIKVEGMSCMHCAKRVEDALKSVKGVKKARVDLTEKTASVDYVESKVSRDELVKAVCDAGFDAQ